MQGLRLQGLRLQGLRLQGLRPPRAASSGRSRNEQIAAFIDVGLVELESGRFPYSLDRRRLLS
jgi:hypothetical protein